MLAFVESALERSSPKPEFTQRVLAALPAASAAKAVGAGLAAASGSAAKGCLGRGRAARRSAPQC